MTTNTAPRRPSPAPATGLRGAAPQQGAVQVGGPTAVSAATPAQKAGTGVSHLLWGNTPRRMRLVALLCVLAMAAFGMLGLLGAMKQADGLRTADDNARQLVGVQQLRNSLVAADASAAAAFLGQNGSAQEQLYASFIDDAAHQVANLSAAFPADAAKLAGVNEAITQYSALIALANANNRQGFPVGSAYLTQASTLLRQDALPVLDDLVRANADRAAKGFGAATNQVLLIIGITVALVVGLSASAWLARSTHRVMNVGVALAIAVVLGAGAGQAIIGTNAATAAKDARESSYARTLAVSQALSLATEAQAMESFTLIKRGSGQVYEEAYQALMDEAGARLANTNNANDLHDDVAELSAQHTGIRSLDDGGKWDEAVAAADTLRTAFFETDGFAANAQSFVERETHTTHEALERNVTWVSLSGWFTLALGIVGAGLAWWGVSLRWREYQ